MMQPWIMNQVAKERQREFLMEAERYKIAAQMGAGRSAGLDILARIKAGFQNLLFAPRNKTVGQEG